MSCPALTEFDIGWICALAIEAAAASEMLDEKFEPLQEQDAGDSNIYTLGRIGNHNIAIACLPAGQYGTTSATTVAKDMLRTFSNSLRVGLMVGVGGGIPSPDHDIRLGDIVISCPDGASGGVTQYDMGKISVGGKLQRTGSLNSPPRSLLAAVNVMRAAELTDDPRYPQYLQNAAGRTARTKKNFSRPDSRHDRLFRIEHPHPEATKNCDTCLAEWEEPRDEREDDFPQPFYGIIASGNVVIKDASTRESIRSETGALCFEMEAAGLMQDFPCIVIRGICDYSDSHKNKAWQGYAALAAASYAKELVETLPRGQVARERLATDICRSVQKLHEDVKGTNQRLDKAYHQQSQYYLDNNQRQCHQVFKTSIYQQYKDNNPNRERETCQWVLQDPIYLRWRDSYRNDLLLVSADPGCGKSVLAKSLIDHDLKKLTPSASICYFFFKDNELQNKLSIGLCAILHQLFSQQPSLLQYAIPSWEKNGHKLQDEVGELWSILLAATSHPTSPNTICVLDALDECHLNDRKRLIQELKAFYTSGQGGSSNQPPCLKFIVTSRPYAEIISGFRDITRSCRHIHLSGEERNALIHKEIDLVVRIKVQELAEITGISQKVQEQVEQQLLKMEHRTYLWLHLAMDDIRTMFQDSLRPAEQAISLVPTSVSDAYARILERVPSGQEDTVRKIFQIIVGARRPLSTREMAMALGVATKPNAVISADAILPGEGLKAKLRRLCGLFIFIDDDSKVHLIHQTAKEFLGEYNAPSSSIPFYKSRWVDTQDLLASVCVRYLLMEDLDSQMHEESDPLSFLRYSAVNWADHVRNMCLSSYSDLKDLVYLLYGVFTVPFDLWFSIFELESSWSFGEWKQCFRWASNYEVHAMHLAAFNGHGEIVQRLVLQSGNTTVHKFGVSPGSLQRRPRTTVIECHEQIDDPPRRSIVQEPLNEHSTLYVSIEEKTIALCIASIGGYHEICQFLLEQGASPYPQALEIASYKGHYEVAQVLLDKGTDDKLQYFPFTTALEIVSTLGHYKIAQLLLRSHSDVNYRSDSPHQTSLVAASKAGQLEIVQLLLEHGAALNTQSDGSHECPFVAACTQGHLMVVRALLEAGARPYYSPGSTSPLFYASRNGHVEIVRALIEYGADPNLDSYDGLALGAACEHDNLEVTRYLLLNGADVDGRGGKHGLTALVLAAREGNIDVVRALLEAGADVHIESNFRGNALITSSRWGHLDTVQSLLDFGADVNAYIKTYGTALQFASIGGDERVIRVLLDRGANVNAPDGRWGNALHIAFRKGYDKIVQLLLENGAIVDAQNGQYDDDLQIAFQEGHDRVMRLMMEKRANGDYPRPKRRVHLRDGALVGW